MTMSGSSRILGAVGAALALTLTGPAYAGDRAASKVPATPVVGECRSLTVAEAGARSDTSPPIDCALPHNMRVIAVKNLPGGASYDDLATQADLFKAAEKICYPALHAAVGQTDLVRDQTAYSFVFFTPTKQQRADGARWLRCDLTLLHNTVWGDLPTDAVPALSSSRIPASAKRCLTGANFFVTPCTAPHTYRATGAFTVAARRFPGSKQMIKLGNQHCASRVSSAQFRFSWKPKAIYNGFHDHTIVCYSKTRS
jgi:hypothetical protein